MKEKNRLLSIILIEGIIILALGIVMILLPQLTGLAAAMVLSLTVITYGIYKFVNSIILRKYIDHFAMDMIVGILMTIVGIYLFVYPSVNLIFLTILTGVFFLVESINTTAFSFQIKNTVKFWWLYLFTALLQFGLGMLIILGLPLTALWVIGLLLGINFVFGGMTMIVSYLSTIYIRNEYYRERI